MQEFPVRRNLVKGLPQSMVAHLQECFDQEPKQNGSHYRISYGALAFLDITIGPAGKSIVIETESNKEAADEVIIDTNRRFRKFLDLVTGYSTKERVKLAKSVE
ncbi:MAG: DUF5611 family protein [Methanoregulaceae archaeon]|nr:DUF5611 family protein [Methanoregulaceae archaeon]